MFHLDLKRSSTNEKQSIVNDLKYPGGSLVDAASGSPIIFSHEATVLPGTEILAKAIPNTERYTERALVISRKDKDTVLLNQRPDSKYIDYLWKIGLSPQKIITFNSKNLNHGIQRNKHLKRSEVSYFSPYYSSTEDLKSAQRMTSKILGAPEETVLRYYDKASFKNICKKNNIPVPQGEVFQRTLSRENDKKRLKELIHKYLEKTGEVIIRETCLASGVSLESANKNTVDQVANKIIESTGRTYLVEVKENVVDSPSIIGYTTKDEWKILAQTTQLLDKDLTYLGSLIEYEKPINQNLEEIFKKIGKNMISDGYVGAFGIDFIETQDKKVMPVECNARITGAFYPHEVRQRALENGGAFKIAMSFNEKVKGFHEFEDFLKNEKTQPLLYKGGASAGIIPFNIGTLESKKFYGIILANSKEEAFQLKEKFKDATS
jgi:hypothetical protein